MDNCHVALPLEDVLPLIFEHIMNDYQTLYQCTLVDHAFNRAASAILYRRVVFWPAFTNVINLSGKHPNVLNVLNSASLTAYAKYVHEVVIGGHLEGRRSTMALITRTLSEAVLRWTNLTSVVLCPNMCHPSQANMLSEVLRLLLNRPKLQRLAISYGYMDEEPAHIITRICSLCTLKLYDPTRAILELLPEWLSRISETLESFQLKGNCGSVTPGVLRSLLPSVKEIESFSLGLSYSLEDGHVFDFLRELRRMHTLELRYYWQIKQPLTVPEYPQLQHFTVQYNHMDTRYGINHLCKWTKRIISHSPIQSLTLICDNNIMFDQHLSRGPHVSFDSLGMHLIDKHSTTLRTLRMEHAFLGLDVVRQLCLTCYQIEELEISSSVETLKRFSIFSRCMKRLRSVTLTVCHVKKQKLSGLFGDREALEFFERGSPALRVLRVNSRQWEAKWITVGPSKVQLVVEMVSLKGSTCWNAVG